jgi:hypothetical protein
MKKTITTLLILFLTLGLFAETGYAGREWGDKKETFYDFQIEDEYTLSEQKVMLNTETTRYYFFGNGRLWGVSYSLPESKTEEIKSKFKSLAQKQKLVDIPEESVIELLKKEGLEVNEKNLNLEANKLITFMAMSYSLYGIPEKTNGAGTVYAYDYNDDTRVYIFEKMLKGKTIVVYSYFEQDY